jgi:hypothetical protein
MIRAGEGDVRTLGPLAVAWRAGLVLVLGAGFVLGSVVGQDDWWPFSPWRMFSTSTSPHGAVVAMSIERRTADGGWEQAPLSPRSVGLSRAEVEGRVPQLTADPAMLGTLAATHARLRPDDPPWTGVRVVRNETVLADRRPTGEVRRTVIAEWRAR